MLHLGIIPMRISATVPALLGSLIFGSGAYWFNGEIDAFAHQAKNDLKSYVVSVPRDLVSLKYEATTAEKQLTDISRQIVQQLKVARHEFRSFIVEDRYRQAMLDLRPAGSITLAVAFAVIGFIFVYVRVNRKPEGTHTRLKVF